MTTGPAIYFDGKTSARHEVSVTLGVSGLQIAGHDGQLLAEWPFGEIESLTAPDDVLRLGRQNSPVLERLEIHDAAFAASIDAQAPQIDRAGRMRKRQRVSVIAWTVAATASLLLVAWFGVPAIAERLAPLIPAGLDRRLGDAVDIEVRGTFDTGKAGVNFECGSAAVEKPGRAAFDKLVHRLEAAAGLPTPLRTFVVRNAEANAIALPGGQVYVFRGLIDKADNADELAGVIAHEMGHVVHRDGTKAVLQAGGLSFLFGMLLGDFVGGGAVVIAAKTLLQSSYSREAEAAADAYGVELMDKARGNARGLATMLAKLGGATEPGMKILLDHPETKARVAAINRLAGNQPVEPFLNAGEWAALKKICAG